MKTVEVTTLKCEYRDNPLGITVSKPRVSWKIVSDRRGTKQQAYQLQVAGEAANFDALLWDSGKTESEQSIHIEYGGPALRSRTRYHYRVKVWDTFGNESAWSGIAWWETALLQTSEWQARWIMADPNALAPENEQAIMLRKRFELKEGISSARVYATAAGVYELHVNGTRVGEELLAPGWTSYKHRLQYQTYDVTAMLREGGNGIGMMLADGWYKSGLGFPGNFYEYGEQRAALVELHVRYDDGTEETMVSDSSWQSSTGPVLLSTLYDGETYDARLEKKGWAEAEPQDMDWCGVELCEEMSMAHLVAQENSPTVVTERLRPIATWVTPAGGVVLDMGQNMVGRIRLSVSAPAGTRIVLKHAEVLDQDGQIYFGNLRSAKQTVEYITKGEGVESYAPLFTFQGFRYVQVEGYPGQEQGLSLDAFIGEVIHTDMEPTGEFETSSSMINQLQSNIVWGQRGNFLDVPTDCPQRDERLGWTGDAQVFISTALFNYHGGPFFTKWLRDLQADQLPDGGVPFVIPSVVNGASSAAWGDAAVICPWTLYQYYGDVRLLSEQYESMKAWVEYIRAQGENEYLWNTGFHFGDWLALDAKENSYIGATPTELVATAYYAYSTGLLRQTAEVLNKAEDAGVYGELHGKIVEAFRNEFITPSGRMAAPTQTAHILALVFDLVEGDMRRRVARELNELLAGNNYHLTTGFVGTPYLCFALSNNGYHETAVKVLLQESYPGWLYSVSKGATTIWEHWDSIKPDGSFWSDDMNSFNHYSYGAIGDWMYRKIAGLDMDEAEPAYKRIRIQPLFGLNKLTQARAAYESMYGRVESSWSIKADQIAVAVTVPTNTTAEIILQGADSDSVLEGEQALGKAEGIIAVQDTEDGLCIEIGSGAYRFTYRNADIFRIHYTVDTRIAELLDADHTKAILEKHFPQVMNGPSFLHQASLRQLAGNPMGQITAEQVNALLADLAAREG